MSDNVGHTLICDYVEYGNQAPRRAVGMEQHTQEHKTMGTQASAKKVYGAKVCKGYLGISEAGCNKAFDLLIDNMKRGYEALA